MSCIGEPLSWLRLEQAALGARDAAVDAHLSACPACRGCLDGIRGDAVAMPRLAMPEPAAGLAAAPWWRRFRWAMPAIGAALAAAAILVLVMRPRDPGGAGEIDVARDERRTTIKGVGELVVGVIRDRGGAIGDDATTFRATDRWKVVVTCPPTAAAWIDVAVVEVSDVPGAAPAPDYPLAATRVACGNRVVLPGAFALTGARANRVCAVVAAGDAPARGALPADAACVTIRPE